MDLKNSFKDLHYYVIEWSFNDNKPVYINVIDYLDGEAFDEAINKYKSITNYAELYRWVSRELKYAFMSKAEHEMVINGILSNNDKSFKIDVWEQLIPNLELIVDYINDSLGLNYVKSLDAVKKDLSPIKVRGE